EIEPGGRLIWLGQPVIVGSGAAARVSIDAVLAPGAAMLRGDGVVFGRAGERCGALQARTRIVLDGAPLLDETLDTGGPAFRSAVVAGDATMVAAVTLAGVRDPAPPAGAMQAHGAGSLWRGAGGSVAVGSAAAATAERWRTLVYELEEDPDGELGGELAGGSCSLPDSRSSSSSHCSAIVPRTDSKIVSP